MSEPILETMQEHNLDEFIPMCRDSYAETSPHIKQGVQTAQSFAQSTRIIVKDFIKASNQINKKQSRNVVYNIFVRINGVMAYASFTCELFYYLDNIHDKYKDQYIQPLKSMDLSLYKKQRALVGYRGVANKNLYGKGIMKQTSIKRSKYLVEQGYTWLLGGIVNPRSLKINLDLGAEIIKTIPKNINGKIINSYLIKRDLRVTAAMELSKSIPMKSKL